ncbi:MAG: hypothetical protein ACP5NI_07610 [Acetobacteraceae bacterium]
MSGEPEETMDEAAAEEALAKAGTVIDRAIGFLMEQDMDPVIVASALLGGALGMLAQCMEDEGIVQILENAIESVEAGEFRRMAEEEDEGEAKPPA